MMVKICGITNREDAEAAVDAGASAIGLNFYRESPRYVSPTGAAVIAEKLPAHVRKVGVFVDESADKIAHIALQVGLDVAQLHGSAECQALKFWQACPIDTMSVSELLQRADRAEALLLDSSVDGLHGGTGIAFNWELARRAAGILSKKIVIAGGLDENNVEQAIEQAQPWGVDVCSRIESAPGRKDHAKMKKFIRAALGRT